MTPSRKPMETYLNLHAHRPAASPSETVVRNYILPLPPSGHEEPEYGQTFSAGIHPWYIPAHPEETLKELERLAASLPHFPYNVNFSYGRRNWPSLVNFPSSSTASRHGTNYWP